MHLGLELPSSVDRVAGYVLILYYQWSLVKLPECLFDTVRIDYVGDRFTISDHFQHGFFLLDSASDAALDV